MKPSFKEFIQVVLLPGLFGQDMDHDVSRVHNHPWRFGVPFDMPELLRMFGQELFSDFIFDGVNFTDVACPDHDELVHERT